MDFAGGSALPSGTIEALLPIEEPVAAKGGKWVFDKAAKVTMKNGVVQGIDDPKKPNLSGMKLTYAPKTGVFKGSFRLYADLGGRLKRRSVSVSGFVVGGAGHGRATIKKPAASWTVSVE